MNAFEKDSTDRDEGIGTENEDSDSADVLPAKPNDDDEPAGDTDQHSDA
jgi:hypothetical protein